MKESLINMIGALASHAYQTKYISHGTREHYEVPDELLEDALYLAKAVADQTSSEAPLNDAERVAIAKFLGVLTSECSKLRTDDPRITNEDLINLNPHWSAIRIGARRCLEALGIGLDDWEAQNL